MGSFPPTDATVYISIDENGDFAVKPVKCWVKEGGTVTFVTEKTAAQVFIPDTNLVFESGMQGPGTASLMLSIDDGKAMSVGSATANLPYSVFQVEEEKVIGGLERAPVIIIVKTARR